MNLELYAWIVRGTQRVPIINAMNKPMTPSLIRKKAIKDNPKISLNNTSDILREFKKKGLVVCLNDKERMGRIYRLTKEGEEIREELVRE